MGKEAVILGAGEIADYHAVRRLIHAGGFVICADGGYRHCEKLGLIPDMIIGDFDSLGEDLPADIPRIALPCDKDYTDSAFAVEKAVELRYSSLLLTGMLGGRLDHTIANLQLLGRCASQGLRAYITDGVTTVYAVHSADGNAQPLLIEPRPGHYFSVFSLSQHCRAVTIDGAVYPLDRYPLSSLDPRAVSNEFRGKPVKITVQDGTVLVIITRAE